MADDKIMAFIIGIVLILAAGFAVADQLTKDITTLDTVANESLTLTVNSEGGFNGTVSLANEPVTVGSDVLTLGDSTLVRDTNYTIDTVDASVTVITNYTNSLLNASYSFEPSGFISSGITKTIVDLIPLFVAVVAILFVSNFIG